MNKETEIDPISLTHFVVLNKHLFPTEIVQEEDLRDLSLGSCFLGLGTGLLGCLGFSRGFLRLGAGSRLLLLLLCLGLGSGSLGLGLFTLVSSNSKEKQKLRRVSYLFGGSGLGFLLLRGSLLLGHLGLRSGSTC